MRGPFAPALILGGRKASKYLQIPANIEGFLTVFPAYKGLFLRPSEVRPTCLREWP